MLDELDIRNIAIIDHLHIRFQGGLTVLTGETGAGKSIIIDALGILMGGRAGGDMIREGESQARVEGVFLLPEDPVLMDIVTEYGLTAEDGTLIVARELARVGRGGARVNGRAVPIAVLQRLGERLVDIHGQTEHLALLRAADQLDILDRYAGLTSRRGEMADLARRLRALRAEIARLSGDEREAARRLDLLRFQVEEIDRACLRPGEEEQLVTDLRVLAGAEKLRLLAGQLHAILAGGEDDGMPAEDVLGKAAQLAADVARIDPAQEEAAHRIDALLADVQDIAREVRRYADAIEEDPERLAQVLERQELLRTLKRKYGATIAEILAFRDEAAADAAAISHSDERRRELAEEEARTATEAGLAAAALSAARQQAATLLADRVQEELGGLNLHGATFQVRLHRQPDPTGLVTDEGRYAFDLTGLDRVEFLVAPNVGESPKPVAKIASGGETSRIMLALKSALADADQTATLVFDEVDVGVGGRSGRVIGEKLWLLAQRHQVLCITHLPQVAVFGDHHQRIRKLVREERTATEVEALVAGERVDEVAQMLGGRAISETTKRASQDLLEQAERWKVIPARG
jgi:DNA repair protein RecN (Recombination protein N)